MQVNLVRELAAALAKAPTDAPYVILDALRDLRDTPEPPNHGICGYVEEYLYEQYADGDDECWLEAYQAFWEATKRVFFKTWPDSSGDEVFPVGISEYLAPAREYTYAVDTETVWLGKYGEARKELLLYLMDEYAGLLLPGHAARFEHNQPEEDQ